MLENLQNCLQTASRQMSQGASVSIRWQQVIRGVITRMPKIGPPITPLHILLLANRHGVSASIL
jgi:hypothetical protein